MIRISLLGVVLVLSTLACRAAEAPLPTYEASTALVEVGFSRGAMGTRLLLVWKDGNAEYSTAPNLVSRAKLSRAEMAELESILSGASADALHELRSGGYQPGRSDAPEVEVRLGNKDRLGFPVCENGPPVSSSVQLVIDGLNQIAERHFGASGVKPFPETTCEREAN